MSLVINCKATLQIMQQWHSKYQKMTMIVLPKKKDHPMSIQYFMKQQEEKINEMRLQLNNWQAEVTNIY